MLVRFLFYSLTVGVVVVVAAAIAAAVAGASGDDC